MCINMCNAASCLPRSGKVLPDLASFPNMTFCPDFLKYLFGRWESDKAFLLSIYLGDSHFPLFFGAVFQCGKKRKTKQNTAFTMRRSKMLSASMNLKNTYIKCSSRLNSDGFEIFLIHNIQAFRS